MKKKPLNLNLLKLLFSKPEALEFTPKDDNGTRLLKSIVKKALDLDDANAIRMCLECLSVWRGMIGDSNPTQDDELSHGL